MCLVGPMGSLGIGQLIDMFAHALAHGFVWGSTNASTDIVRHVCGTTCCWSDAGDGWMARDEFEEELRPDCCVKFLCPFRCLQSFDARPKSCPTERGVDKHCDTTLFGKRQNSFSANRPSIASIPRGTHW